MKTRVHVVSIVLASIAALFAMLPSVSPAAPSVSSYTLVSSQRVTRTEFNYTYQVAFQNAGDAVSNVVAHVASNASATVIVDGDIAVGDMLTDASATSATDTITFRQDRSLPFNPANLNWRFDYTPVPASQTAIIDANGGTFEGPGGAVLAVAPGALSAPVTFQITRNATGAPAFEGVEPITPIYEITPHGQRFGSPATVLIPFDAAAVPEGALPFVVRAEPGGTWDVLTSASLGTGTLAADVESLSWFAVVVCYQNTSSIGCPSYNRLSMEYIDGNGVSHIQPRSPQYPYFPVPVDLDITTPTNVTIRATWTRTPGMNRNDTLTASVNGYSPTALSTLIPGIEFQNPPETDTVNQDSFSRDYVFRVDPAVLPQASQPGGTVLNFGEVASFMVYPNWPSVNGAYSVSYQGMIALRVRYTASPPTILQQPAANTYALLGSAATFSVDAIGTEVTYQWQRSDDSGQMYSDIPMATYATYELLPTVLANNGALFRVHVCSNNGAYCVDSTSSLLTVQAPPPYIGQQPASVQVVEGDYATFVVSAAATDISYQWQRWDASGQVFVDVPGATTELYNTGATTLGDNGAQFRVRVCSYNGVTCIYSATATLTVVARAVPIFSVQPVNQTAYAGETVTFVATASSTPASSVQWYKVTPLGDVSVGAVCSAGSGSTTLCTYATPPLTLADSQTEFYAVAENGGAPVQSNHVRVLVQRAPVITSHPQDVTVSEGQVATFSVVVDSVSTPIYRWFVNGNVIPNETRSSYTTRPVQLADDGSSYDVEIEYDGRTQRSGSAYLHVVPRPTGQTVCSDPNGDAWCWIQPAPQGSNMHGAAVIGNSIVAVGGGGTVMRGDNGGQDWSASAYRASGHYADVTRRGAVTSPDPADSLIAVTDDCAIERSFDGGFEWEQTTVLPDLDVVAYDGSTVRITCEQAALTFGDADHGIVYSRGWLQYWVTSDGGATWTQQLSSYPGGAFQAVQFIDAATVVAFAGNLISPSTRFEDVYRSTDGGQTFTPVWTDHFGPRTVTRSHSSGVILSVGGPYNSGDPAQPNEVLRSTNGGQSWVKIPLASPDVIADVTFLDGSNVLATTYYGKLLRSADAGLSWSAPVYATGLPPDLDASGYRLSFVDAAHGVAFGPYGAIHYTADGGSTWRQVAGGSKVDNRYAVAFSKTGAGLVNDGIDGSLLRSTDYGATWQPIPGPPVNLSEPTNIGHVSFISDNEVIALSRSGPIWRSSDAGLTWSLKHWTSSVAWSDAAFATANIGVIVGGSYDGVMWRTTDAGTTWAPINNQSNGIYFSLRSVAFATANVGVAVGDGATLLRSTDAGATWTPISVPDTTPDTSITGVRFTTTTSGVISGVIATSDGTIYQSTDLGLNWVRVFDYQLLFPNVEWPRLADIAFTDKGNGVAVGSAGVVLVTGNGGASWTLAAQPTDQALTSAAFADANTVVVVGDGGAILRNQLRGRLSP